jgi:hypothetical protein
VPSEPSSSSENNSYPSSAAAASSHVRDDALAGRLWLRGVLGRDDYDHRLRQWRPGFEIIASKPEAERAAAAAALQRELEGKPETRKFLTPEHVAAYWLRYASGESPGPKVVQLPAAKPGEGEIAAKTALIERLEAQMRTATNETKARVIKGHVDTAQKQLAELKEKYQWTG